MQFRFEANQEYQQRAVASVADLFEGMDLQTVTSTVAFGLGDYTEDEKALQFDRVKFWHNIRQVQGKNTLPLSEELKLVTAAVMRGKATMETVSFPNVTVEMETGTGKTYVYLRTALELHRRYALSKFIIVVPSVAVREGVKKTFEMTREHFAELFGNVPYQAEVYDSKNLTRLRDFTSNSKLHFLIMTIAAFNKDSNVIGQSTDRLGGKVGLEMIQAVKPVLILDEPQNMESELSKQALASLHPLVALRYSATHREAYNQVYRLGPAEAYQQGLVKKISVASVLEKDSHNTAYVKVLDFASTRKSVSVKIEVEQRMADGEIKRKSYKFNQGDGLMERAERPEYAGFVVDHIDIEEKLVQFTNGVVVKQAEPRGVDYEAIIRAQIRYTVKAHLLRQAKLREQGVKVLSLFFIDHVESYAGAEPFIRNEFDEAFNEYKKEFPEFEQRKPEQVRAAYFATKPRKAGLVEYQNSSSGESDADRAAYTLIMKDKERLLSFDEPVCFLFSHSALREGWDNPNVFQICTLNQTTSTVKKRQEIGRGLRLAVGRDGIRLRDDTINVLTVVANESYEQYVASYQAELSDDGEENPTRVKIKNEREKVQAKRQPLEKLPAAFRELWERIKHRTRYNVTIDTETLVAHTLDELNRLGVVAPRIEITTARVAVDSRNRFTALQSSGAKTVAYLQGRFPLPNVVELIAEFLKNTSSIPVRLTRTTLRRIVEGITEPQAILDNPNAFARQAADIIRTKLEEQLVEGIRYEKDGTWFDQEKLFPAEVESSSTSQFATKKSLYDLFIFDSEVEKKFAQRLEERSDVTFYVKLPRGFKVRTPIGHYNPDWAIVMEERDEHEQVSETLYLVRETKSTLEFGDLRPEEFRKLKCGSRHFNGALGVSYKVILGADHLPHGGKDVG